MKPLRRSGVCIAALTLIAASTIGVLWTTAAQPAPSATREVVLLYTNDFESAYDPIPAYWRNDLRHLGGISRLATLVERQRAAARLSFLLDAGDIFTGTLAKLTRGELPFELMMTMGYDAMCIGNHEFEYGWQALREQVHRAPFPVLAANLFYESTDIHFTRPWAILERDGFRIGVIGILGQDAATALFPPHLAGLEVRDPVDAVRRGVAALGDDVDLLVLLTHEGKTAPMQTDAQAHPGVQRDVQADLDLAGAVDGVDVLIGGHADAGLETPLVHPETGALVCQTYGHGMHLGVLKLVVDLSTHRVVAHDGRLVPVDSDSLPPHPAVAAKLASYRARHPDIGEVLGRTATRLNRVYDGESTIGDLFADILREHGGTSIGLIHSGSLRADLPAGEVTREDLLDAFPFLDRVVTLEMRGRTLLAALEHSFSLDRGVLQVSGLVVRYDPSRPVGARVVDVEVGGRPLDPARTYRVTTLDFLARGADGYVALREALQAGDDGPAFADLIESYFSAHEVVAAPSGGRQIPIAAGISR